LKGAIVFLVVFIVFVIATLGYLSLPPGGMIYDALNVPDTDYPVLGIPATNLVISVFNGVVYGVIVWLIYTVVARATKREKKPTSEQQVKPREENPRET
jgi:hypothetical protein